MLLKRKSLSKINIFLNIQEKLSNSYHRIETFFFPIRTLYDELSLEISEQFTLTSNSASIHKGQSNLCFKAYDLMKKEIGFRECFHIHIEKRIPISAGMGGGSSNAATTLLLINQFFDHSLDKKTLHTLASQIGADVPFFLYNTSALATGIGDILYPIECQFSYKGIIIDLAFPISSAWAYAHCQNFSKISYKKKNLEKACQSLDTFLSLVHNDLFYSIKKKVPLLEMIIKDLENEFFSLKAGLTGSGPTIFAFFDENTSLNELILKVKQKYSSLKVFSF